MASKFLDIPSAIVGNTVYSDGKLVARNVAVTLPEISQTTAEVQANGTAEIPITAWYDNMELTINVNGLPKESLGWLARSKTQDIEIRAVEDVVTVEGEKQQVGIKAFLRAIPSVVPQLEMQPGEIPENEMTFTATRYELLIDNRQQWCFDRLNNIDRRYGIDYGASIESML